MFFFGKGSDICVHNSASKRTIKTKEGSYQYDGEIKSVSGNEFVTMKRFCIIQMMKKDQKLSHGEIIESFLNGEMKSNSSKNNCIIC